MLENQPNLLGNANQLAQTFMQQPYMQRYERREREVDYKEGYDQKTGGWRPPNDKNGKNGKGVKNIIPESKRLTVFYIVFIVWIALAVFAILTKTDLVSLAIYFASGLPLIISYLWSETSRPSGSMKDLSRLVGNMRNPIYPGGYGGYGGYPGGGYPGGGYGYPGGGYGYPGGYGGYPGGGYNPYPNQQQDNDIIIIISDDGAQQIQVDNSELDTLVNSGYVNKSQGKYTFRSNQKETINSLLKGGSDEPSSESSEEENAI